MNNWHILVPIAFTVGLAFMIYGVIAAQRPPKRRHWRQGCRQYDERDWYGAFMRDMKNGRPPR